MGTMITRSTCPSHSGPLRRPAKLARWRKMAMPVAAAQVPCRATQLTKRTT